MEKNSQTNMNKMHPEIYPKLPNVSETSWAINKSAIEVSVKSGKEFRFTMRDMPTNYPVLYKLDEKILDDLLKFKNPGPVSFQDTLNTIGYPSGPPPRMYEIKFLLENGYNNISKNSAGMYIFKP